MPVSDVCHQPATDGRSQPACHGIGRVGVIGIADNEGRLAANWSEVGDGAVRVGPSRATDEVVGNGLSTTEGKCAARVRAREAVEAPLGWAAASLQVMLQREPTSEFPFKSVSRPKATARRGAPLPAAAAARAGK